jgi:hypothetical protein
MYFLNRFAEARPGARRTPNQVEALAGAAFDPHQHAPQAPAQTASMTRQART